MGIDLEHKKMLDIGTGNGMIPQLILRLSDLQSAMGTDPFLDGEHKTSWQVHDRHKDFARINEFIDKHCNGILDYSSYQSLTTLEHNSFIPQPLVVRTATDKPYTFKQIGVHDLGILDDKYDIFYCKAIEHIHNWDEAFNAVAQISRADSIFYLKHRSFFDYILFGPNLRL